MKEIITIANQKGGVGKTTTAVNLATFLALAEKDVLLIDLDSQANATASLGFYKNDYKYNIYHSLTGVKEINKIILNTTIKNLDLIPSNIDLVAFEKSIDITNKEFILKKLLNQLHKKYDFIIIDTSPRLDLLTLNALSVSDSVIIPMQTEFFALEGVSQLLNTIKLVKSSKNSKLTLKGIIPTMYSSQNNLSKQVLSDLVRHFKNKIFLDPDSETKRFLVIPRNVRLAEAPSFGKPVALYDIKSKGAIAYQKLAKIVLNR